MFNFLYLLLMQVKNPWNVYLFYYLIYEIDLESNNEINIIDRQIYDDINYIPNFSSLSLRFLPYIHNLSVQYKIQLYFETICAPGVATSICLSLLRPHGPLYRLSFSSFATALRFRKSKSLIASDPIRIFRLELSVFLLSLFNEFSHHNFFFHFFFFARHIGLSPSFSLILLTRQANTRPRFLVSFQVTRLKFQQHFSQRYLSHNISSVRSLSENLNTYI